jgi:hypothetical protein
MYQADIWPTSSLPCMPSGLGEYMVSIRLRTRAWVLWAGTGVDVEVSDVVRGLVAVRVLADEAGDVRRRVRQAAWMAREEPSSLVTKGSLPPKSSMRPAASCCTPKVVCQAFDSV